MSDTPFQMTPNVLYRTKTYLVGAMQYKNGEDWRNEVGAELSKRHITVFNPYHKPFIKDVQEGDIVRRTLNDLMDKEKYDEVQATFKEIRAFDLNLVDRSDFIIAYIIPTVPTIGTVEELVTAVRMKKPTFIAIEGGKKKCPLWYFGMFPHKYIYNSLDDMMDMIYKIDDGVKEIDSDRWRLLKKEYR
jgi:nucleoside 2-deoxyribosyltransferase